MEKILLSLFITLCSSAFAGEHFFYESHLTSTHQDSSKVKEAADPLLPKKVGSNVQSYTPSSMLPKGGYDVTLFNSIYTQNKFNWKGTEFSGDRETFYTSLVQGSYGISNNGRLNIGIDLNFKSSGFSTDESFSKVSRAFAFENNDSTRVGLSSIAFRAKIAPFKKFNNLSIESSFSIPLIDDAEGGPTADNLYFLDWARYIWWNRIFFDKTFYKMQIFTEADLLFRLRKNKEQSNILDVPVSVFLSYFPNNKSTLYVMTQHVERTRIGKAVDPEDVLSTKANYTTFGFGGKYQVSRHLNLELLYTNFVRAESAGLGETYNIGLKYLFN